MIAPTAEVFADSDANKDGKLSSDELPTKHARDALPFIDLDGDKAIASEEWDYYKAAMESENGMLAIKLGGSRRHDGEVGAAGSITAPCRSCRRRSSMRTSSTW